MLKRLSVLRAIKSLEIKSLKMPLLQRVVKSPAGGYTLQLKMIAGTSFDEVSKKSQLLAVALKLDAVNLKKISSNKILLTAYPDRDETLPKYCFPDKSSIVPKTIGAVPIGLDASGHIARLTLFNQAGGTVTLIGGNPGKGKSSLLKIIFAGLIESNVAIIWFDPKSGADARPYLNRVQVLDNSFEAEGYLLALQELQSIVLNRNSFIAKEWDTTPLIPIVVIIDEWGLLAALGNKALQSQIQTDLRKLVATARSSKIAIILATQRPTKDNIDVTTRELSSTRIAFSVGDIYASESILGVGGAEATTTSLPPGSSLVWSDGDLTHVQIFQVPPDLKERSNQHPSSNRSIDEIRQLDDVFRREHERYAQNTLF